MKARGSQRLKAQSNAYPPTVHKVKRLAGYSYLLYLYKVKLSSVLCEYRARSSGTPNSRLWCMLRNDRMPKIFGAANKPFSPSKLRQQSGRNFTDFRARLKGKKRRGDVAASNPQRPRAEMVLTASL